MTNFIAKIKKLSIVTIIAALVIGAVLIAIPEKAMSFVSLALGITLILVGIGAWIDYFVKNKSAFMPVLGTISAITGIIICARYKGIIALLLVLLGIFLLCSGLFNLFSSLSVKSVFGRGWLVSLILAALTIILGLVVVLNPFDSAVFATRLLGVALYVYAALDIVLFFQVRKTMKIKTINDTEIAEIDVSAEDIE